MSSCLTVSQIKLHNVSYLLFSSIKNQISDHVVIYDHFTSFTSAIHVFNDAVIKTLVYSFISIYPHSSKKTAVFDPQTVFKIFFELLKLKCLPWGDAAPCWQNTSHTELRHHLKENYISLKICFVLSLINSLCSLFSEYDFRNFTKVLI